MTEKTVTVDIAITDQCELDLRACKALLRSPPKGIAAWGAAIGEANEKNIALRIGRALDILLPGLFSCIKPGRLHSGFTELVSPNRFSTEKLRLEMGKMTLHSPKLSFADADATVVMPLDSQQPFDGADLLIGSHYPSFADSLDFYTGANYAPLYKLVRHAVRFDGVYRLPSFLKAKDLPAESRAQIADVEHLLSIGTLSAPRAVSVPSGLPQILIPDTRSPTGYLSITPLASGAVLNCVSQGLRKARAAEYAEREDAASDGREAVHSTIKRAEFFPNVSNKQNLSGLIGQASQIYLAEPPSIKDVQRIAYRVANDLHRWLKTQVRDLMRSRHDAGFRHVTKGLRTHIDEILGRLHSQDPGVINSTTINEREYEINAVRFLVRPIVARIIELSEECPNIVHGTRVDLQHFDVGYIAEAVRDVLIGHIGIAVSEHTRQVWLQHVQVEIFAHISRKEGVRHVATR